MSNHDGQEIVVVDIAKPLPQVTFAHEVQVSEQLAKTDIRRQCQQLGKHRKCFLLCFRDHGTKSPILGSDASFFGSLPITST